MWLIIAIASVSIIAAITWVINGISDKKICPICAGVFGTWLWMLAGRATGLNADIIILAVMMGGSIVGITYQLEKRNIIVKHLAVFKFSFTLLGFMIVYFLINNQWLLAILGMGLGLGIFYFLRNIGRLENINGHSSKKDDKKVKELEEKMKNCC